MLKTYDKEGPIPEGQEVVKFGSKDGIDHTISGKELHLIKHFLKNVT
jgi:hypothetical protein